MASQTRHPPTLDACIQALAQELQDLILDFTIAVDTNETITITSDYKPPVGLQINKKLRSELAKVYYSSNVFQFWQNSSKEWLPKQDPHHLVLFKEIRMEAYDGISSFVLQYGPAFLNHDFLAKYALIGLFQRQEDSIKKMGLSVNPRVFKFDWKAKKSDGSEEVKWLNQDEFLQLKVSL